MAKADITTLAEVRDLLHGEMLDAIGAILPSFVEDVLMSEDPDVKRKALAFFADATGLIADKKADPLSNLPVFNFNFGNGGVQISATSPDGTTQTLDLKPTPAMLASASVNADILEMVESA